VNPPIVVADDDVDIFQTVSEAERHLEPVDVRKGKIRIYDREGRPIRALIRKRLLAEVVELEETSDAPRADELRQVLLRFLESADEGTPIETLEALSLNQLVDRAVRHKTR
jgi:hypothetical protein